MWKAIAEACETIYLANEQNGIWILLRNGLLEICRLRCGAEMHPVLAGHRLAGVGSRPAALVIWSAIARD